MMRPSYIQKNKVQPASTRYQRDHIRRLMARNELPTRRTTLLHRIPFRAAGLPEPLVDVQLEPVLEALTFAQASTLIKALKKQAGIEDDDDD